MLQKGTRMSIVADGQQSMADTVACMLVDILSVLLVLVPTVL